MLLSDAVLLRFPSAWLGTVSWLGFVTLSACHSTSAPAAPPATTAIVSAPSAPPPPPPPPECKDLKESCRAATDTQLPVGDGGAWFTPPEGWTYARSSSGSVAQNSEGTALLVLTPSPDPADVPLALEALATERGVTGLKVDKLKRRMKKPQQSLPAAEGTVDLWEVDKAQQGQPLALADKGTGTLLVLVGKPSPEQTLIGVAFVVETAAEAEAPKIMQSVQTLRGKR